MAFELLQELPSGISGNYWKMSSALVSCNDNPVVSVYMDLYLSRDARMQGKTPITNESYSFLLQNVDMSYSFDFRVCLYKALRSIPKWENAIDIFDDPNKVPVANNVSITTSLDTSSSVTLSSWDPFNLPLNYSIVDQPLNGTFVLTDKEFVYTPASGFYGEDTATYKTSNGLFDSNIATINITVNS